MAGSLVVRPIGVFRSQKKNPAETASQGNLDKSGELGIIELDQGQNFEQALRGLSQMSHMWVIFWFHHKEKWKPLVSVPRGSDEKMGVFATRSPHRPVGLGLSLVEIADFESRKIWIRNFDLMDETPILDLKPYHPEADVPQTPIQLGWMENLNRNQYQVVTTPKFDDQAQYLKNSGVDQLVPFCAQQLRFEPFDSDRKRVKLTGSHQGILSYRTWRIHFHTEEKWIRLERITSGYSVQDLLELADKWQDKDLHRDFIAHYPSPLKLQDNS